jgi:hypothetical protein
MTNQTLEEIKLQVEQTFIEVYTGTLAEYFPIVKFNADVLRLEQYLEGNRIRATTSKFIQVVNRSNISLNDAIEKIVSQIKECSNFCLKGGFNYPDPHSGVDLTVSTNIPRENFILDCKESKYEVQEGFEGVLYVNFDKTELIQTEVGEYILMIYAFPFVITPEKITIYSTTKSYLNL